MHEPRKSRTKRRIIKFDRKGERKPIAPGIDATLSGKTLTLHYLDTPEDSVDNSDAACSHAAAAASTVAKERQ